MWDDLPLDPTAETWQNDAGSRPPERTKIQGMPPSQVSQGREEE
jgi:hypothetical protein